MESSNFVKNDNWASEYCNVALDLSNQGYNVFVSSHESVREYLSKFQDNYNIIEVFPNFTMYDEWIRRLENRYRLYPSDKNKRAYDYVSNSFFAAIANMMNDDIELKLILDYNSHINDLSREIREFCSKWGRRQNLYYKGKGELIMDKNNVAYCIDCDENKSFSIVNVGLL